MKRPLHALVLVLGLLLLGAAGPARAQTSASAISGYNPSAPATTIMVDYLASEMSYKLQVDLVFDPTAGPMLKMFRSPYEDTLDNPLVQLDALQPFPQPVWEDFQIISGPPPADWHEEILTPGWEWVLPGDDRFPTLFPADASLITLNGNPHPWQPIPMPGGPMPHMVWAKFPPIPPGNTLDIHKALLWVGTPGDRIWGDMQLDDGVFSDESYIVVREYPTPEPASIALAVLGALGLVGLVRSSRRKST